MLTELGLATIMVVLTVTAHGIGLHVLTRLLRNEAIEERAEHLSPQSLRGFVVTLLVILGLVGLHGLEIWIYALLYVALDAVQGLREAVYFSTITYAAIGYEDVAMAEQWRLISAIEGINGVIMIGWSTAFFVGVVAHLRRV